MCMVVDLYECIFSVYVCVRVDRILKKKLCVQLSLLLVHFSFLTSYIHSGMHTNTMIVWEEKEIYTLRHIEKRKKWAANVIYVYYFESYSRETQIHTNSIVWSSLAFWVCHVSHMKFCSLFDVKFLSSAVSFSCYSIEQTFVTAFGRGIFLTFIFLFLLNSYVYCAHL